MHKLKVIFDISPPYCAAQESSPQTPQGRDYKGLEFEKEE